MGDAEGMSVQQAQQASEQIESKPADQAKKSPTPENEVKVTDDQVGMAKRASDNAQGQGADPARPASGREQPQAPERAVKGAPENKVRVTDDQVGMALRPQPPGNQQTDKGTGGIRAGKGSIIEEATTVTIIDQKIGDCTHVDYSARVVRQSPGQAESAAPGQQTGTQNVHGQTEAGKPRPGGPEIGFDPLGLNSPTENKGNGQPGIPEHDHPGAGSENTVWTKLRDEATGFLHEYARTVESSLKSNIPVYGQVQTIKNFVGTGQELLLRYKAYRAGPLGEASPSSALHAANDILNPVARSKEAGDAADRHERAGDHVGAGRERFKQLKALLEFAQIVAGMAAAAKAATGVGPAELGAAAEGAGRAGLEPSSPGAGAAEGQRRVEPRSVREPAKPPANDDPGSPAKTTSPRVEAAEPTTRGKHTDQPKPPTQPRADSLKNAGVKDAKPANAVEPRGKQQFTDKFRLFRARDFQVPTALQESVKQLHDVLDNIAQSLKTTAVGIVDTPQGPRLIVASSDKVVPAGIRRVAEQQGIIIAPPAAGHAEVTIVDYAKSQSWELKAIAPSRDLCANCWFRVLDSKAEIHGVIKDRAFK